MRVSPEIESLIPYKPGKPISETKREYNLSRVVKLASNENALGPSPLALKALKNNLEDLARYPDPSCFELKKELSEIWKVRSDDIVLGNGSNELIDLLIRVFCEPGDKIVIPDKSFVAYSVCAQAARVGRRVLEVDENFQWDVEAFVSDALSGKNSREKILFVANPNNPTGTYIPKNKLDYLMEKLGHRKDFLIVFDEAYTEFVRAEDFAVSFDYFRKYENAVVLRTFSKVYGLAGLRLGALIGSQRVTQWIERVRNPFNVNTLVQVAAGAALKDKVYLSSSQKLVWEGLDLFYGFLKSHEIDYHESQANFVLFDSQRSGTEVFQSAMKKGLILRPMVGYGLPKHIRMSVGTEEENRFAIEVLKQVFDEVPKL